MMLKRKALKGLRPLLAFFWPWVPSPWISDNASQMLYFESTGGVSR
jgi:hypothetical protein